VSEEYKAIKMINGEDSFFVIYTLEEMNIQEETEVSYTCDVFIEVHMIAQIKLTRSYDRNELLTMSQKAILLQETGKENSTQVKILMPEPHSGLH
jgi:hypothetical protein